MFGEIFHRETIEVIFSRRNISFQFAPKSKQIKVRMLAKMFTLVDKQNLKPNLECRTFDFTP